jgi:hypothetical protein
MAGACRLIVTAEHKVNRFGSRYIYYHCSKRNVGERCRQPYIEEANLKRQFREFLARITVDESENVTLSQMIVRVYDDRQAPDPSRALKSAEEQRTRLQKQLSALTGLRVRDLVTDEDYLERLGDLELEFASVDDRVKNIQEGSSWFEPAQVIISFLRQALDWFETGSSSVTREIVGIVGSNYKLTDEKLDGEGTNPFSLRVEEHRFSYLSGFLNDIRTRFSSRDPEFMDLLERIRLLIAKVEAEGHTVAPSAEVGDGKESSRGGGVLGGGHGPRRRKGRRPALGSFSKARHVRISVGHMFVSFSLPSIDEVARSGFLLRPSYLRYFYHHVY